MELKVIDVSTWQGDIDWARVKPQIAGALLRTGYGRDYPGQEDEPFKRNARECTRLGIPFGVYHYSYADTEEKARSEAAHILRLIKPFQLSYPVYLDCEEERDSIRAFAARACEIVGEIIEGAGYWFGVYANLNWMENYLASPSLDRFTKWVAQYNDVCQYAKPFDIWQYSSTGAMDGIGGDVDLNLCYRDFPAEIGKNGLAASPGEPEKPSKPAKVNVTYQTHNGSRWLPEVKNLTDYAGNLGQTIDAVKMRVPNGTVRYRVHNAGRAADDWCGWITCGNAYGDPTDTMAYAGNFGVPIDGVQAEIL